MEQYDMREFLPEDDVGFSSFAHFIGLTRTLDLVLSRYVPRSENIKAICTQIDISLSAWCSLLPPSKQLLLNNRGEVDMQMYKANMLINTCESLTPFPSAPLANSHV